MSEPTRTSESDSVDGVTRLVAVAYATAILIMLMILLVKWASPGRQFELGMSEGGAMGLLTLFAALIVALFVAVRSLVSERGAHPEDDLQLAIMASMLFGLAIASAIVGVTQIVQEARETTRLSSVLVASASVAVVTIAMMGARVVPESVSRGYDERARRRRRERAERSINYWRTRSGSRRSAVVWTLGAVLSPLVLVGGALALAEVNLWDKVFVGAAVVVVASSHGAWVVLSAGIAARWELAGFVAVVSAICLLAWIAALLEISSQIDVGEAQSAVIVALLWLAVPSAWVMVVVGHFPGRGLRRLTAWTLERLVPNSGESASRVASGRVGLLSGKVAREVRAMLGLLNRD